ncbi:hypothetical protein AB0J21_02365 [Streptomyces sp. NPDC049954]|uniref:hypothetical protein n=1 Tax=Streptomyces sp. NPDC049954 TaxID=3155779 RepID=UPI00342E3520
MISHNNNLTDPRRYVPPPPEPGCATCCAYDRRRTFAQEAGDLSAATDFSVLIGRHPHGDGPEERR